MQPHTSFSKYFPNNFYLPFELFFLNVNLAVILQLPLESTLTLAVGAACPSMVECLFMSSAIPLLLNYSILDQGCSNKPSDLIQIYAWGPLQCILFYTIYQVHRTTVNMYPVLMQSTSFEFSPQIGSSMHHIPEIGNLVFS